MPVPDQTRNGAEYCLRVRGDSMDEVFPEGTLLFCRPFFEEDHALPVDKYVIAVTSSAHTDQIEATVKRLVRNDNGDLVLRPESRNKILHGRDLALGANTELGTEVRISAVVVGYTRQLN